VDRRGAQRLPAAIELRLALGDHWESAVAYDISTDGCLIEAHSGLLVPGDTIQIEFPGMRLVCAQAVWTKHRNAGLQFGTPLPHGAVLKLAQGNGAQSRSVASTPGLPSHAFQADSAFRSAPVGMAIACPPFFQDLRSLQYAVSAIFVVGAGLVLLMR
jgi:hypothetical protein